MGRKALNKVQKHFRVNSETVDRLNELAVAMGYIFGRKEDGTPIPATGELLDAIGSGEVLLVPSKKQSKEVSV